jgi:hypothetical protein
VIRDWKTEKEGVMQGPGENASIKRMKSLRAVFSRLLAATVALVTIPGCTLVMLCQDARPAEGPTPSTNVSASHGDGAASDWTHRHVIFSEAGTAEEAMHSGFYDRWLKITKDPRYTMQQRRRSGGGPDIRAPQEPVPADGKPELDPGMTDEDEGAGEAATPATEEEFPGGILRRGVVRALIPPQPQQSKPRGEPPRTPARPNPRKKTNLFQKDWSETLGSTGTTGLGNFPATFTKTSTSCTADFAVYNTGLEGSSSQASVIAFNHLYSGCSPRPSVDWAYDTGGTANTSVTLSIDGTQVVFVQTDNSTGYADLVVLKWAASSGTLSTPVVLTSNSTYPNCTAPCMISIPFIGSPSDSISSPFIDYSSGTAYVGDDAGSLHKFANIFSASTPVEAAGAWPVTLNISTDAALSSPVYDSISGNVFVGDYLANTSSKCQPGIVTPEGQCGYLYSVNATSGTAVRSAQLDYNFGIQDGPIVDSNAGMVYAFVGADNSTSCSSGPCAAVFQFPVSFTNGASGTEATVGAGYEFLMSGSFDNQYFTSGNSPSGHLYVVGGTGPQNNTLYAITVTNNVMTAGSGTAGPQLATNYTNNLYAAGLPVTDFCNNGTSECTATQGTDYLFLSVPEFGSQFSTNPCPNQIAVNGCIMGFTAPASGTVSNSATPNGTLEEAGGTSGIVVDNGASGASNIYFSTLLNQTCATSGGNGSCAVSATQTALQ